MTVPRRRLQFLEDDPAGPSFRLPVRDRSVRRVVIAVSEKTTDTTERSTKPVTIWTPPHKPMQ